MTSRWSIIFFIAMVAPILHSSTAQRTHVVGDTSGWAFPSSGAIVYSNWASQQTFTLGDVLVFNFTNGRHNVAEVSKTAFDACNTTQTPISIATNSPVNITLNSTGEHYYICTFTGHCDAGMKLAINVSSPSTNTTNTPPPPSQAPAPVPSPSRTTSPPPSQAPTPVPSPSRSLATYMVGDSIGWTFPSSGNLTSYAAWASNKTFFVGDTLVFNFTNGSHNVAELTSKADFDSCNTSSNTNAITTSPARVILTTPGEHFYICTFNGHCDAGMKLAVNVSSSSTTNAPPPSTSTTPSPSSSTTNAPSPSTSTTPSPPPPLGPFVPIPPPPPSSASKFVVASAMPITFLSIAFALLY